MVRLLKYFWFKLVMLLTYWMTDVAPVLKLRGFLLRPAFKKCGKNLQIACGVIVNWSSNVEIGDDVFIANNCWIQGVGGVVLHDKTMLGPFTVIASNNHSKKNGAYRFGEGESKKVVLNYGCWTGSHVTITAGIEIGNGTAVAAGAVVTKSIPSNCVAAGVPAIVIKTEEL